MQAYYEKNTYLLNHEVNKTFENILAMSDTEFRDWCIELRKIVVYCWDTLGIPPRVGYNTDGIIEQFQQMDTFPVQKFIVTDELTGNKDTIRNTHILGNAVNQWFPSMLSVRINYTEEDKGRSIYDFFAQDELLERFITYAKRHFKRDSFYAYSVPLQVNDMRFGEDLPTAEDAMSWLYKFHEEGFANREIYSYWLAPVDDKEYTGYNEALKGQQYLLLTKDQIKILKLAGIHTTNVSDKSNTYQIRVYKFGQQLFPIGLKAWRVSFCQYPANFPPLTAKLIYEMYTEKFKQDITILVWDPSMGWGGRLLGALTVKDDRTLTYLR